MQDRMQSAFMDSIRQQGNHWVCTAVTEKVAERGKVTLPWQVDSIVRPLGQHGELSECRTNMLGSIVTGHWIADTSNPWQPYFQLQLRQVMSSLPHLRMRNL